MPLGAPPAVPADGPASSSIDEKVNELMAEDDQRTSRSFIVPKVDYGQGSAERKRDLIRKNPLVPLGALLTAGVLVVGLIHFKRGNSDMSNKFMRYRIMAQGATVGLASLSLFRPSNWFKASDDAVATAKPS